MRAALDDLETVPPAASPTRATLHFDGGARNNGKADALGGAGAILTLPNGRVLQATRVRLQGTSLATRATNNTGEYAGVITGLRLAHAHAVTALDIFGDSALVIGHLLHTKKCGAGLLPFHKVAMRLLQTLTEVRLTQIPRAQNSAADAQANDAMDDPTLPTWAPRAWLAQILSEPDIAGLPAYTTALRRPGARAAPHTPPPREGRCPACELRGTPTHLSRHIAQARMLATSHLAATMHRDAHQGITESELAAIGLAPCPRAGCVLPCLLGGKAGVRTHRTQHQYLPPRIQGAPALQLDATLGDDGVCDAAMLALETMPAATFEDLFHGPTTHIKVAHMSKTQASVIGALAAAALRRCLIGGYGLASTPTGAARLFALLPRLIAGRLPPGRDSHAELTRRVSLLRAADFDALAVRQAAQSTPASPSGTGTTPPQPGDDVLWAVRRRVQALVGQGHLSRAMSQLTSSGLAPATSATAEAFASKFPQQDTQDPAPGAAPVAPPRPLTHEELFGDIGSLGGQMRRHRAPGQDAWHTETLAAACGQSPALAKCVLAVANAIISGGATHQLAPALQSLLRDGRGVALAKGSTDVRPIVITSVLRRAATQALVARHSATIAAALGRDQYAVGVSGGVELASLALRAALSSLDAASADPDAEGYCCVALDLRNAYNSVSRASVRVALLRLGLDMLVPAMDLLYASTPRVVLHQRGAPSRQVQMPLGVMQGDPLSTTGFCAVVTCAYLDWRATQCLVRPPLLIGYADDGNKLLSGPPEEIAEAIIGFFSILSKHNLVRNSAKCSIWVPAAATARHPGFAASLSAALQAAIAACPADVDHGTDAGTTLWSRVVDSATAPADRQGTILAGVPMGTPAYVASATAASLQARAQALRRVAQLAPQAPWEASQLAMHCAAASTQFISRTTPPYAMTATAYAAAAEFDRVMNATMARCAGTTSLTAAGRLLAAMPARMGGLGLGSADAALRDGIDFTAMLSARLDDLADRYSPPPPRREQPAPDKPTSRTPPPPQCPPQGMHHSVTLPTSARGRRSNARPSGRPSTTYLKTAPKATIAVRPLPPRPPQDPIAEGIATTARRLHGPLGMVVADATARLAAATTRELPTVPSTAPHPIDLRTLLLSSPMDLQLATEPPTMEEALQATRAQLAAWRVRAWAPRFAQGLADAALAGDRQTRERMLAGLGQGAFSCLRARPTVVPTRPPEAHRAEVVRFALARALATPVTGLDGITIACPDCAQQFTPSDDRAASAHFAQCKGRPTAVTEAHLPGMSQWATNTPTLVHDAVSRHALRRISTEACCQARLEQPSRLAHANNRLRRPGDIRVLLDGKHHYVDVTLAWVDCKWRADRDLTLNVGGVGADAAEAAKRKQGAYAKHAWDPETEQFVPFALDSNGHLAAGAHTFLHKMHAHAKAHGLAYPGMLTQWHAYISASVVWTQAVHAARRRRDCVLQNFHVTERADISARRALVDLF